MLLTIIGRAVATRLLQRDRDQSLQTMEVGSHCMTFSTTTNFTLIWMSSGRFLLFFGVAYCGLPGQTSCLCTRASERDNSVCPCGVPRTSSQTGVFTEKVLPMTIKVKKHTIKRREACCRLWSCEGVRGKMSILFQQRGLLALKPY